MKDMVIYIAFAIELLFIGYLFYCAYCVNRTPMYKPKKDKKAKLTIEDIQRIDIFLCGIRANKHGAFTFSKLSDEQYAEVLKRHLEAKQ